MKKLVALLLALCLMCGAMTVMAEEAVSGTQEVKGGKFTFQIPAELEISYSGDDGVVAACDDYTLTLAWLDWAEIDISEFTTGGIQFDNLFAIYYFLTDDSDTALYLANDCVEEDIGMLNGDPVMHGWFENSESGASMAVCSQYYRNTGFILVTNSETGTTGEALMAICDEIARSFRLEGVSEEDMIADAAQDYIVITGESAKVRTEASISGGLIKTVYTGETFPYEGESGDFYIIEIDGKTGYVHKGVSAIQ